jgi:hypothetical protein
MKREAIERLRRNCCNWAFWRISDEAGDYMVEDRINQTTDHINAVFDAALAAIDYVHAAENRDPDKDWSGKRLEISMDAYKRMCEAVNKLAPYTKV